VLKFLRIKVKVDPEYANVRILNDAEAHDALLQVQQEMFNTALISDDPAAQQAAKEAGAKVFVDSDEYNNETENFIDESSQQTLAATENIFVHKTVACPVANTANILNIANQAINRNAVGWSGQSLAATVAVLPTDEFTANEKTFLGGFGSLFFLGEGVPQGSSSLSASLVEHLLMQYDNRFATNAHFLFTVFNQIQRHAAASNITFRVKSNSKAFATFKRLMATPDFASQLNVASQDPDSVSSKQLARTVLDIAEISGRAIPWSAMERKSGLCKIIALTHYAGAYSFFVTVSYVRILGFSFD
jgi:hypothetical protein